MIARALGWRPRRPSRPSLRGWGSQSRTPWESTLVEPWVFGLFGWIDAPGGPLGEEGERVRRHGAMTPSSAERDDTPSLR